jgi:hypothetical protein
MSDEQDRLRISLEPPRLFGRKRNADAGARPTAPARPTDDAGTATAADALPVSDTPAEPAADLSATVAVEPEPLSDIEREDAEIAATAARISAPTLPTYPAAALTGVVVGLAMVGLTFLALRGCEAFRGTSSCTGGPGIVLLIAIFALSVLVGSTLLRAFHVADPGSSSFLAVGVVAVIALLFLIDTLDHWSVLVVVPLLSVGAYLGSVWITLTFVDQADSG